MTDELPVVSGLMIGSGFSQGSLKVTLALRVVVVSSWKMMMPVAISESPEKMLPCYEPPLGRIRGVHHACVALWLAAAVLSCPKIWRRVRDASSDIPRLM